MDLSQKKLTKIEWDSIERPVSSNEIEILSMIKAGCRDVNIRTNNTPSIATYLKIEHVPAIEKYMFEKYFLKKITDYLPPDNLLIVNRMIDNKSKSTNNILKKVDQIRISRADNLSQSHSNNIFEFILMDKVKQIATQKNKNDKTWMFSYYTLNHLIKNNVSKVNQYVMGIVTHILESYKDEVEIKYLVQNAHIFMEKNELLKYNDLKLYTHQKDIFTAVKTNKKQLILYITPTGTGKTLTPIGLSEIKKIIFVCAARHVGLALAKSAISIGKKIAFAFGCSSADEVKLHYFAAKEYTVNKRSGGIQKVDNSVGDKVEIIICDIRSYLPAMHYMMAFNPIDNIVTYWDEPTITMDVRQHDLHAVIKQNWSENCIPTVVLSSATLPKLDEISAVIENFQDRFEGSEITNIVSHDCRKTIPLINEHGNVIMPHLSTNSFEMLKQMVEHCENNLTLLRYFDLKEAVNFISFIEENPHYLISSRGRISREIVDVDELNPKNIKLHYLKVLKNIKPSVWPQLFDEFTSEQTPRIYRKGTTPDIPSLLNSSNSNHKSNPNANNGPFGACITTNDAHTLTDGPTIFMTSDVDKIAKFCIQQAKIPASVMSEINSKIAFNNSITLKIGEIEDEIEIEIKKDINTQTTNSASTTKSKNAKSNAKQLDNKMAKSQNRRVLELQEKLTMLKGMIKSPALNDVFVPNKLAHIKQWCGQDIKPEKNIFSSTIEENDIITIMLLNVDDSWKLLLLMGIGVVVKNAPTEYAELVKKMADAQQLYLIIADSDQIYGTNQPYCHGFISKDLILTQEKLIQALGRIGRNNVHCSYSVRFRDSKHLNLLFLPVASTDKPEVANMNALFS